MNFQNIGNHNGKDIIIKKGKYGFYLEYNKKNYKIKSCYNENLDLKQAIECINETESNNVKKIGKYNIKNGEYGYYIQYGKNIRGVPKDVNIDELDEIKIKEIFDTPKKTFQNKGKFKKKK